MPMNDLVLRECCTLFSQPWAMEPRAYDLFEQRCLSIRMGEVLASLQVQYQLPISIEGGVATIPISGVLLKTVPGWVRYWGIEATGYDEIRQMLTLAVANPKVERIELRIDSPGGQVAGGMEAADAIREAAAVKTVTAVVEDLAASGAYWLATSASSITAGPNAEIGSIGIYMVYRDWSKMYEAAGVRTIVIRSGEHKGMGVPGAPITEAQIAAEQEVVDGIAEHFIQQVATGRKLTAEQVRPLATGRVWLAPAAMANGLIDSVTRTESRQTAGRSASATETPATEANESASEAATEAPIVGDTSMPENPNTVTADAALAAEKTRVTAIKAAFEKDPTFAMEAVERGWSVTEAKAERHDRMEKDAAAKPKGSPGVPFGESDPNGEGNEDFMTQAREMADSKKISMTDAMKRLSRSNPALHQQFVAKESGRRLSVRSGNAAGRVTL